MAKATFSLDEDTVRTLRTLAQRQQKPQSQVVREAVAMFAALGERLSEQDRARKLRVLDQMMARPHTRTEGDVDTELREVRRARRAGWRRKSE